MFLLCYKEIKNAISFLIFGILFYRAVKKKKSRFHVHSEIRLFFCLQRKPSGILRRSVLHLLGIHSVDSACRIAYFRDTANAPAMPKGQEGIFCVDSYSQSYFRKVSLNSGVQFPESFRQAVSVQERRLNSGCTIAPTCNVLSADNTSFLILLYRAGREKQYG